MAGKLSKRMEAVFAMVPPCTAAADIGTDHAYVPIALVQRGVASFALAMDVRRGPLSGAEKNIREAGLLDRIGIRLSDGCAALSPGEADVIIISGMGGRQMMRILSDGRTLCRQTKALILQPQSDLADFRRFLQKEGYAIADEEMVKEDGQYYTVIKAVPREKNQPKENTKEYGTGGREKGPLSDEKEKRERLSCTYGPVLLQKRHPVLLEYLKKETKRLQQTEELLSHAPSSSRTAQRRVQIAEELFFCRSILTWAEETPADGGRKVRP